MPLILFKWLFTIILFAGKFPGMHPVYMSVTEIEHNAKDKTVEISCKIFTDDFEKTLRKSYKQKIDLLDPAQKAAMNTIVNEYVQKHLKISVDGSLLKLNFLGYEHQEEGIISFLQADNIKNIKEIIITNNLLYEYKSEQISLIHITVNGNRQSTKLDNPEEKATFRF